MQLVALELRDNLQVIQDYKWMYNDEKRVAYRLKEHDFSLDGLPADTVAYYTRRITGSMGKPYRFLTDALEMFKTTGIASDIADKQVVIDLLRCYNELGAFDNSMNIYYDQRMKAILPEQMGETLWSADTNIDKAFGKMLASKRCGTGSVWFRGLSTHATSRRMKESSKQWLPSWKNATSRIKCPRIGQKPRDQSYRRCKDHADEECSIAVVVPVGIPDRFFHFGGRTFFEEYPGIEAPGGLMQGYGHLRSGFHRASSMAPPVSASSRNAAKNNSPRMATTVPTQPHRCPPPGSGSVSRATISPTSGVKIRLIRNAQPKPIRRWLPMMPTSTARKQPLKIPNITARILISRVLRLIESV